ncbi:MAG TPA: lysophospholipid acyltransferase family protein [Rhizomicrobium sp.]|nr:lysophospholipid acyltransferase family protein [Rhizomicrobium sp.]
MTLLRSAVFFLWFALVSAVICIVFLPALILPRRVTVWMSRRWSAINFWGLRVIAGVRFEVRGTVPRDGVLVAAKHMSMWDTMALYLLLDDPAVVLKRGLQLIPFYGWYITKAGSIAIDRGGGASTLRKMTASAKRALDSGRSILIFPEGTRKKPDAAPDYKPGVAALYSQLGVPCVPAALNSGLFWTGFIKRPGNIVLEFLEPIPPGLRSREFMKVLQERIETATAALIAEGRAPRNTP